MKNFRVPQLSHLPSLRHRLHPAKFAGQVAGVRAVQGSASKTFFSNVYTLVSKIPRDKVVTYGQLARALGMPHGARTVGWAMRACDDDVPWHRVVNAQGKISLRPTNGYHEQRLRLKEEGVKFNRDGKIDLKKYGWKRM